MRIRFFCPYKKGNFFSCWTRKVFDRPSIQQIFGLGLVLTIFSWGILVPETIANVETARDKSILIGNDIPVEIKTEHTFKYPLEKFTFTQGFSWHHWGIDLAIAEGTAIYPVARGKVLETGNLSWGYGKFILIDHENGQRSLYAHFQKQEVKKDDIVSKDTIIGRVGSTGWSSGPHLHLEIYQNGLPLNPLEVLSKENNN